MKIEISKIASEFDGERCYVHARGALSPSGFGIITMQKLELSGCDLFHGIEMMTTSDGGKTFGTPKFSENLKRRYFADGESEVICDATPIYHKKTGKFILIGHLANYRADGVQTAPKKKSTIYAVYNEAEGDFSPFKSINLPETLAEKFYSGGSGCCQCCEENSGELLIPFYYRSLENATSGGEMSFSAAVMRCDFDGEKLRLLEVGGQISTSVPRGFCEPSVTKFGGEYFIALRNDVTGYVAKSSDGINYGEPRELCFDDGESLGNYNTQQHWLVGGGRLWLVYTRRAENNNHVFRHRAPLFIAELDRKTLRILRNTEKIAVPERGARLGNFGTQSFDEGFGFVFASEWMQGDNGLVGCTKYGSDNSIFISKIIFE